MPRFNIDDSIDIDVDEFFSQMSHRDCIEMFRLLDEEGFTKHDLQDARGIAHWEFVDAISKLGDAYHRLSNDEIEQIINLSKRF